MTRAHELSHRADSIELAEATGNAQPISLLNADSGASTWRLIEIFSDHARPFELEARWSAGAGSGALARITVPGATRLCVFARALTLLVTNLSQHAHRVGVTVADGFAPSMNTWEFRAACVAGGQLELPIPPLARGVLVQVADPTALAGASLLVYDGWDILRSQLAGAHQPELSTLVGGAGRIVLETKRATAMRALFHLCL